MPGLYESHNINVQNVSAATALDAIGRRLESRCSTTARRWPSPKIDPGKAMVSFPQKRATYSMALRSMLFCAKLKFEVRYDDANSPFLWITTNRPAD